VRARALLREGKALYMDHELGDTRDAVECLETMARVLLAQAESERAAHLLGAAAAVRMAIGAPRPPSEHKAYEGMVAAVRAALGNDAFAAMWAAGAALPLEEAIAEVLGGEA